MPKTRYIHCFHPKLHQNKSLWQILFVIYKKNLKTVLWQQIIHRFHVSWGKKCSLGERWKDIPRKKASKCVLRYVTCLRDWQRKQKNHWDLFSIFKKKRRRNKERHCPGISFHVKWHEKWIVGSGSFSGWPPSWRSPCNIYMAKENEGSAQWRTKKRGNKYIGKSQRRVGCVPRKIRGNGEVVPARRGIYVQYCKTFPSRGSIPLSLLSF